MERVAVRPVDGLDLADAGAVLDEPVRRPAPQLRPRDAAGQRRPASGRASSRTSAGDLGRRPAGRHRRRRASAAPTTRSPSSRASPSAASASASSAALRSASTTSRTTNASRSRRSCERAVDGGLDLVEAEVEARLALPRRVEVGDAELAQVGDAEQRVAGAQRVVDERERPVLRERDQPERELGHLDGHRVLVDAVQAALGDEPVRERFALERIGGIAPSMSSAP